jgi:hypothetical protein
MKGTEVVDFAGLMEGYSICPKTGSAVYGNLLKLSESKWFL